MPDNEPQQTPLDKLLAGAMGQAPDEPAQEPKMRDETQTEELPNEEKQEEAGDKDAQPPRWFVKRIEQYKEQRNRLRAEIDALREELSKVRSATAQSNNPVPENSIEYWKKVAQQDPDRIVEAAEKIAELRSTNLVDAKLKQLEEADALRQEQMVWLQRAIELWPEVNDPRTPLAQLASAKWQEAVEDANKGKWSPAFLPDGRYRIVAEAAAELEAFGRIQGGRGASDERRRMVRKRAAALETGKPSAGGEDEVKKAKRTLRWAKSVEDVQKAQAVLLDRLIPLKSERGT